MTYTLPRPIQSPVMEPISTYESLQNLCGSIPGWNERLDTLNGQIALRQIELARLTETERPPTRSIKHKGSTESLRPNDGEENPFLSQESEDPSVTTNPKTPSPVTASAKGPTSPPVRSTGALARQASQPTPAKASGAVARKRKTESLASGESNVPKYRTRSMIIVYYDSAVQQAFEDLVKFVSASRNAMRKGKMNAKMAEMRKAAEMELEEDDEEDNDEDDGLSSDFTANGAKPLVSAVPLSVDTKNSKIPSLGNEDSNDLRPAQRLKYVSTRQMGPLRGAPRVATTDSTISVSMLRGYRRSSGGSGAPDIFDTLDKGLEWVQAQCEHAAHQFLRDGDCSTEISNIKKRLAEVKETALEEIEKLKKEGADKLPPVEQMKSKQLKSPVVRKEWTKPPNDLEVDDMEVGDDDEGVDDIAPPKLVFKRSRDAAR